MVDFVMILAGAVREPPEIRALLEAPLHKKSASPLIVDGFRKPAPRPCAPTGTIQIPHAGAPLAAPFHWAGQALPLHIRYCLIDGPFEPLKIWFVITNFLLLLLLCLNVNILSIYNQNILVQLSHCALNDNLRERFKTIRAFARDSQGFARTIYHLDSGHLGQKLFPLDLTKICATVFARPGAQIHDSEHRHLIGNGFRDASDSSTNSHGLPS